MNVPPTIGRYEVLRLLASGGMGTIFLGRDPAIDRLVAIKLLREGFDDPELRERFLHEAQSGGRLRHINIVTIFDVGEHDHHPFIAMEYVEGETLADLIKRRAPISLNRKIQLMSELSAGLQYAHQAGVIHRDIKPKNVMVDGDGVVKILDFGIARMTDSGASLTRPGSLMGTLSYMAPEQMMGVPDVDARADIFSAGAVFYELLTWHQAFPGGLDSGVLHKVINAIRPSMLDIDPTLDAELVAIVDKCLAKAPDDRYPDMAAVRNDLATVQRRVRLDESAHADRWGIDDAPPAQPARWQDVIRLRTLQIEALLAQARSAIDRRDFTAALEACERVLALDDKRSDAVAIEQRVSEEQRNTEPSVAPAQFEGTVIVPGPSRQNEQPAEGSREARDVTVMFAPPGPAPAAVNEIPDVQLVVTRSDDPRSVGRTIRVTHALFRIGRSGDCDLILPDSGWSREHAAINYDNDGFVLVDKGSRNGTYLNGRRVTQAPLLFGNVITIGQTELTFSYGTKTRLPDLTGCVVADRYTLLRLIRESAKGALYAGRHEGTQGDVAIKLLSPDLVRYHRYREIFRREAQIAARLRHPYICSVIDSGPTTLRPRDGGAVTTEYLCSYLMSGGSLLDRLESGAAVDTARATTWLTAVGGALDHAHRHSVLHGDLKPSAIVFDDDDHPYVTDFAIGQQALNAEGRPAAGTPAYMAPELWEDGEITPATDQFALAAIFYYLVTGSRPFEGQENPEVRRRNFRRGVIPAHEEAAANNRDRVPRAVSIALARALSTDPVQRFESAAAFKAALRHVRPAEGPEVFISYQREVSAPLAMYFADRLKAQGIRTFIDTQGIDRAGRFPPQIERAIEDTDVFICLLAETTLDSGYVRDEIRAAYRYEKPMIPVMQESYRSTSGDRDPAVAALLAHQGLPVLDRRNLHLEHTATDLVRLVKSAIAQRDRD
ncbi:MAG TPA: protein kinase [Vicinamibacterales bacterium]|nr:protein kinase [Vicinamibacterales bacterium]